MGAPILITLERFTAATGGALDPLEQAKAVVVIESVSALITAFCGRDFQLHTDQAVTLYPCFTSRLVRWPHSVKPVISVQAVTVKGQPYEHYQVRPNGLLLTSDYIDELQVTLTYGYADVPGDVQAVALVESLYRFNSEPGISEEQVGDLVTDYGLFQPTLSRDARRTLRRYRPQVKSVSLR